MSRVGTIGMARSLRPTRHLLPSCSNQSAGRVKVLEERNRSPEQQIAAGELFAPSVLRVQSGEDVVCLARVPAHVAQHNNILNPAPPNRFYDRLTLAI